MLELPIHSHLNPDRIPPMEKVINEFDRPIKALEIGTWTGDGSTQVWFKNLKPGSTLMIVDRWEPYCQNDYGNHPMYQQVDEIAHKAFIRTFDNVLEFEKQNKDIEVIMIRADSNNYLKYLADKSFDFIYVDGCHHYDKVNVDVIESKRLIKDVGIICGDDLEQPVEEIYVRAAMDFPNRDYILVPGTSNHMIHPGVTLALHENFNGQVNLDNGFWWLYHNNGQFSKERSF